eukprot:gene5921-9751_t
MEEVKHKGSCHCGKVEIEIIAPEILNVLRCNCSICKKKGSLHFIVPKSKFKLISDEKFLSCYQFNTKIAKHWFCSVCGCAPYYVPRSNPDGFDVNVNCLDDSKIKSINIEEIDGKNWEKSVGDSLSNLSKE